MKISLKTTFEEVKCATKKNIDKIPNMEIVYQNETLPSKSNDTSYQYWINKVCNKGVESKC